MYGQHHKLDLQKVLSLKRQGLSNALIARRLGVTTGAIYHVLKKNLCPLSTKMMDKVAGA